jgi:2-desacetyl-2-hydroxyethyl bacteriochlorophyllide A dehydrogenase
MRTALFYGGTDIRVEERAVEEPGPGEVLVRVRSAGICGSDLHGYRGESPWPREAPWRDGHELAGEIVAMGQGVSELSPGQRVGIEPEHLIGCGRCEWCRSGDSHLCESRGRRDGEMHRSRGFGEYDVCVASQVHVLPERVALDAAAILDCYACAVHAVRRAPVAPYATVAVIGTGAIGMTTGQVARAVGAARVAMVGTRPAPLEVAKRAGAADVGFAGLDGDPVGALLEDTGGRGADVVFETVGGTAPTLGQAVRMARRGGVICILGVYTGPPELDVATAYAKELTILWSNSYSTWNGVSEYAIALGMLAAGKLLAEPLITHHFPLSRIGDAFAAAADKKGSGAIKVMVHP